MASCVSFLEQFYCIVLIRSLVCVYDVVTEQVGRRKWTWPGTSVEYPITNGYRVSPSGMLTMEQGLETDRTRRPRDEPDM